MCLKGCKVCSNSKTCSECGPGYDINKKQTSCTQKEIFEYLWDVTVSVMGTALTITLLVIFVPIAVCCLIGCFFFCFALVTGKYKTKMGEVDVNYCEPDQNVPKFY